MQIVIETGFYIEHILVDVVTHLLGFRFVLCSFFRFAEHLRHCFEITFLCIQIGVQVDRFLIEGIADGLPVIVFDAIDLNANVVWSISLYVKPGGVVHAAFPSCCL